MQCVVKLLAASFCLESQHWPLEQKCEYMNMPWTRQFSSVTNTEDHKESDRNTEYTPVLLSVATCNLLLQSCA